MSNYLGIDIGTSGTKALIMSHKGDILATGTSEYGCASPKPGWSEQNPEDWWQGTTKAVKATLKKAGVKPESIKGIGLSGQMHGLVITDGDGKPLRPSLIWNDQRTAGQAAEIEQRVGGKKKLIGLVGNAAMTSFTLTKLLWVQQNEKKIYDKIKHLLLPKDYVRLKMTGEYVGEVSDMSGTLMLNQKTRKWSKKIISEFGIDSDILPPIVESHEITGKLTKAAAKKLGLAEGTPVVGGGGDQPAAAIGNGIVSKGRISAMMGTSGVIFTHSSDYVVDKESRLNTFCSCVDGEWCMFGCIMSAGGSLQWFRNVLGGDEIREAKKLKTPVYRLIDDKAMMAPPGSNGVFFLPYLSGERTPHADPNARGCFIGLSNSTGRNELIRSVIEGATFAMGDAVDLIKKAGIKSSEIRLSGGGAKSPFWRQLQADIYGSKCVTIKSEEGGALGVALLAAVGTGEYSNIRQACNACIEVTSEIKPNPKSKRLYRKLHDQYDKLYPALAEQFSNIAGLL